MFFNLKHRGLFPHRMDARDRHNGQRDKRTNGLTDGRTNEETSLRPSVRPSLRWSLKLYACGWRSHCSVKHLAALFVAVLQSPN